MLPLSSISSFATFFTTWFYFWNWIVIADCHENFVSCWLNVFRIYTCLKFWNLCRIFKPKCRSNLTHMKLILQTVLRQMQSIGFFGGFSKVFQTAVKTMTLLNGGDLCSTYLLSLGHNCHYVHRAKLSWKKILFHWRNLSFQLNENKQTAILLHTYLSEFTSSTKHSFLTNITRF